MISKIIEWDKRRKFGHKFCDFIILFCSYVAINTVIFVVTGKINIVVFILSLIVYELLVNREPPDNTF